MEGIVICAVGISILIFGWIKFRQWSKARDSDQEH